MRASMLVATVLLAAAGLAGCGDRPQEVSERGYRGKPDTNAWDNDATGSLYTTSKWTRGDKNSWEDALKLRASSQNEYNRVQ
jgi:hypothetical protein